MLQTFVTKPNGDIYLNTLRRSVRGVNLVPAEDYVVTQVPTAPSSTNPGVSAAVPISGADDGSCVVSRLLGIQGLPRIGSGTITTTGAAVAGTGTKFTIQLTVGTTIKSSDGQTKTISAIASDTAATVSAPFAPDVVASTFVIATPVVAAVRDRMTVILTDLAWRRDLMNRDVPVNHVYGDNQKQLWLMESLLLEKNQTVMQRFYNNAPVASGPGSISTEFLPVKWQVQAKRRADVAAMLSGMNKRKTFFQPYWLTLDNPLTLASNSSGTGYLTCTRDVTLILFNVYGHAITAGNTGDTQELATIELQDTRTGRFLQNQPFTINTGCGTAQNPLILPTPHIMYPQSQLKVNFTNLVTNGATDVFLTLHGVALYTGRSGVTDPAVLAEAQRIWQATKPELIRADIQ